MKKLYFERNYYGTHINVACTVEEKYVDTIEVKTDLQYRRIEISTYRHPFEPSVDEEKTTEELQEMDLQLIKSAVSMYQSDVITTSGDKFKEVYKEAESLMKIFMRF